MDNLRGAFDSSDVTDEGQDWDAHDEDVSRELPPEAIGQDERRMQVRAYNHWASLLGDRTYPSIEDLEPHNLNDFGPNSVLLDFSGGIEDPGVQYLGGLLAEECGAETTIKQLSDVPPRSLLSRITDHYMQILANEAPIGFEAEFVNQRGATIMYRGILLPFSSDDETIDFIYGVINWKEIADQTTADELLLEIDQALELGEDQAVEDEDEPQKHHADPVTDWADSPAAEDSSTPVADAPPADVFELDAEAELPADPSPLTASFADNVASLGDGYESPRDHNDLPLPDFGQYGLDDPDDEDEEEGDDAGYSFASLSDYIEAPAKKALDLDAEAFDPANYAVDDSYDEPVVEESDEIVDPIGEQRAEEEFDEEEFDEGEFDTGGFEAEDVSFDTEPVAEEPVSHNPVAKRPALPTPVEVDYAEPSQEGPVQEEPASDPVPVAADQPEVAAQDEAAPADLVSEDRFANLAAITGDEGLYDCLASARELAENARQSEDRSRQALYAAVGRAYDVSLAAEEAPEDYQELLDESGLSVQDRAPMTPIVKLVFGVDYDKTRLTEYATVLTHAHRKGIERGALADFLSKVDGGLKGIVAAERRLRREEAGHEVESADEVRRALAEKLRQLEELTFEALSADGPEFSVVVVRRDGQGGVAVLGEVDDDIALIERAAKKLVG